MAVGLPRGQIEDLFLDFTPGVWNKRGANSLRNTISFSTSITWAMRAGGASKAG